MKENSNDNSNSQPKQPTAKEALKALWAKKYFKICTISVAVLLVALIVVLIVINASPKKSDYFIGDEISNSKSSFCVNSAYNTSKVGQFGTVTNGYYIVISVTYTNKTNNSVTVKESNFLLYSGSKKYKVSSETLMSGNPLILYEEVGAGISKSFTVVFETPTDIDSGNYVLSFSSPTGNFNVNIVDKENDDDEEIGYH